MFDNYKVFDSEHVSIPPWQRTQYASVVERAQLILQNRSKNEQKHTIEIINEVLKKHGVRHLDGFETLKIDRYSAVAAHVVRFEFDNERGPSGIRSRNPELAELLAVLALALVQEGFVGLGADSNDKTLDFRFLEEAEETIDWAERYHNGSNLPTDLLSNIDQLAGKQEHMKRSLNAITGYAQSDNIKQRFIDGWIAREYTKHDNRMNAALEFFDTLDEDDISDLHLSSIANSSERKRGARLLCSALRQYLKKSPMA